jgi:hypothetical protein
MVLIVKKVIFVDFIICFDIFATENNCKLIKDQ